MTTPAPIPARVYAEMTRLGFTRATVDTIAQQATIDQQAGTPLTRGREQYETTPERVTYQQAWLASMATNGPSPLFAR